MSTTRVTITMDEGVYRDALAAAAEHGVSVSAWISRCARVETMRDALSRHQQWCAAEDLSGPGYDEQRAHMLADAAVEVDRARGGRGGVDAA